MKALIFFNIAVCFLFLTACIGPIEPHSTFEDPYYKRGKNLIPPFPVYALRRAAELKNTVGEKNEFFGCVLNDDTMSCYVSNAPVLVERCLDFGFTDIFLQSNWNYMPSEKFEFMKNFVVAAIKSKLKVSMILDTRQLYGRHEDDGYIKASYLPGIFDLNDFFAEAEWVRDFNDELTDEKNISLSGVALRISPSHVTLLNRKHSNNSLFSWSDRKYGYGNDNDMLMKKSFELLHELSALFKDLPLTVVTENFYHEATGKKLLSCGNINDFLVYAWNVVLLCPLNSVAKINRVCRNEFRDAGRKNCIIVGVDVLRHVYQTGDKDFAGNQKWKNFVKNLDKLYKANKSPAFKGVIINNFEGVESYLRRARD